MRTRTLLTIAMVLLVAVWAASQTLPAKRSDNYDPNTRDGRFDLRVRVDGATDFYIRGSEIRYVLRNGRPPRDEGSEYRQELPRGPIEGLNLEQRDGRNPIRIVEEPSRRNNWTLALSIDDRQGGDSRYHARITWTGSTAAPLSDRPGGIGIGGQGRGGFDRGRQLGLDDARRGLSRDYRRHSQEFDSRNERSFQVGYEQGYDANRGSDRNVFDRGVTLGSDDARRGLSRDHRRYNTEYDLRSERNFQQGYEQGYDANRGGSDRTVIDRGYRLGSDDARRNLSRDYRRYNTEYDSRTEASFRSGYEQGYDAIRGSGTVTGGGSSEARQAYDDGRRYGQRDAQDRLRPDYKRYSERYNSRTESEFRRGYQDGYYNRQ